MFKKGLVFNPIDIIAGLMLILSGLLTTLGMGNFGAVIAGIALVIEALKIMMQLGL